MRPSNSSLRQNYSLADFLYTLHLLHHHQHLGRYKLAQELRMSDVQTRIILQKLVEAKIIEKSSQRRGHRLSSGGREYWSKCQRFFRIPLQRIYLGRNYTVGNKDAIVCVQGTGVELLNTVILRDESLLNGALGCTVFLKTQTSQFFLLDAVYPPLPQVALTDRKTKRRLSAITKEIPWQMIVIIVGTADHIIDAQIGAISAALLLVPEEIKRSLHNIA